MAEVTKKKKRKEKISRAAVSFFVQGFDSIWVFGSRTVTLPIDHLFPSYSNDQKKKGEIRASATWAAMDDAKSSDGGFRTHEVYG